MHRLKPICRLTAVAVLCAMGVARAGVTLSSAFGGGMVLQQAMPLPIWGWADAGEKVSVRLDQATQTQHRQPQSRQRRRPPRVSFSHRQLAGRRWPVTSH